MAWQCESPDWKPFSYKNAKDLDTCDYGDQEDFEKRNTEGRKAWTVGQCTDKDCVRDNGPLPDPGKPGTNLVVAFTKDFDYCFDWSCQETGQKCKPKL